MPHGVTGNTSGSDPLILGSNPGEAARYGSHMFWVRVIEILMVIGIITLVAMGNHKFPWDK